MADSSPDEKFTRRPRYRGRNPRRFGERYKELEPARYAGDVAKVLAAGRTPAGSHRPILVQEILEILAPRPGEVAVDCTLGFGGHARELFKAVQPGGKLIAIDVDPIEGPKAEARLRELGFPEDSLIIRQRSFAGLTGLLALYAPEGVDMILADLGVSSMQLDDPARGFTFKDDGPLDMRMNPGKGRPAVEMIAILSQTALARVLEEHADEPRAGEIAAALVRARARSPIDTTMALAAVVRSVYARRGKDEADNAVRRVFQAIRIAVNDEFAALDALLQALPGALRAGGRVAVLTFHSGEDRRVKAAFREGADAGVYSSIASEVIRPGEVERRSNPRSAAAKLRFAVRSRLKARGAEGSP